VITPDYCLLMARYNRWMNERLYALLTGIADDERKKDRGAYFGSMHATLNHLLWGDRMWLGRFTGEHCTAAAFGTDMYPDFAELTAERERTDRDMLNWAGNVTPAWLAKKLRYTSKVDNRTRDLPHAAAAVHLFNHGTHHRGQLTTLMKQAGVDPGATDLPWLPGVVNFVD